MTLTGATEKIGVIVRSNRLGIAVAVLGAVASFSAAWALLGDRVARLELSRAEDAATLRDVQRGLDRLQVDVGWIRAALEGRRPPAAP